MTQFASNLACITAAAVLSQACSSYFGDGPDPARDGRVDAGAAGAASVVPTELVSGVAVNALALDADTVYFTSNEGLAKIAKKGGSAVPLGGFSQLNGLAVDAHAVYAVNNNGILFSVHKNGSGTLTLSSSMCGGGSGAVAITADNAFFSTGPYLRSAPLVGGTTSDLASNVWQAGGPAAAARLTLDAHNAYYVGAALTGGLGALYGVAQSGSVASCVSEPAAGTRLASAKGTIAALAGDGTKLYFTDLTSNGLSPVLVVSAIVAPSLTHATVIDLGKLTADSNNNNTQSAGNALASDGTYLYFGGFSGIYRVLVGGPTCSATALPCSAPELVVPNAVATALAVDSDSLYYGDQNGNGLKKVAK